MQVNEINKNQGLNKTSKTTKSSPTTGTSFSAYLEESMKTQTTPLEASGNIAATDALLAAQMVEGDEKKEQKKKQLERGEGLLSRLEEIRDALLQGTISKERLAEIARFVRERQIKGEDERLNEVLAEIELRVEVELAKLTK